MYYNGEIHDHLAAPGRLPRSAVTVTLGLERDDGFVYHKVPVGRGLALPPHLYHYAPPPQWAQIF